MKAKTKNLFTTKELIEQLVKIAEEPNSVSQGWYQIVMSEAKQFLKNDGCPDVMCEHCTKEDCEIKKLGLVEVEK